MTALSRDLARYVIASDLDRVPDAVRREGSRTLVNWFGCVLGGSRADLIDKAFAVADRLSGPRYATALGRGARLDIVNAAFLNCFGSSLNAFDDTHLVSIVHPTGPVASVALALAEQRGIAGRDFLHAVLLGIEIECRMGCVLMEPPGDCSVAFTMTGLVGGVGAAACAGKLLGLDEERLVNALGIAAVQAAGYREGFGTMTRDFPMAQSARSGLIGALLAAEGFTAAETTLDGPRGLVNVFATTPNIAAATRGLGERYELLNNAYKPYPCGIVIHPAIDACMEAMGDESFDWRAISDVKLAVHPDAIKVTGLREPENGLAAQISVYHWAAATLIRRQATLEEATDAASRDGDIRALRARVVAESDPRYGRDGAGVEIRLKDGRRLEASVEHCRGSAARPMTTGELEDKTRLQARGLLDDGAIEELLALCRDIERVDNVGQRVQAIFPVH
jgi:2-methylcitrate dehydratase PrpD